MNVLLMTSRSWAGYNISPPIGLYQLKCRLSEHAINCEILDFDLDDGETYRQRAAQGDFDVIGMSVTHISMSLDLDELHKFRSAAKASGKPVAIVAGGQEATLNAQQWLDSGVVDICFFGYCDFEFAAFCQRFNENPDTSLENHTENLAGVAYYDVRGKYKSYPSPLLDAQRFQELFYESVIRTEIPYDLYWSRFRSERVDVFNNNNFTIETVRLYTSSHCPRKCGFCSSQNFLSVSQSANSKIIALEPEQISELVKHSVREYGAKAIMFSDDDFPIGGNAGLLRFDEFCDLIVREKAAGEIPQDLRLFCQSRVLNFLIKNPDRTKRIDNDRLERMKLAGFDSVGLGVETLSDELLRAPSVNKLGTTITDIDIVLKALIDVGITPMIYLILGIPESTPEQLIATIRRAVEYLDYGADISLNTKMRALPGAPITLVANPNIEISKLSWSNPDDGRKLLILNSLVPSDPAMRILVDRLDLERDGIASEILEAFSLSERARLPRSLFSILGFAAAARLVGRIDVADELLELIENRLPSASHPTLPRVTTEYTEAYVKL